jgi:hypothetical protein
MAKVREFFGSFHPIKDENKDIDICLRFHSFCIF